MVEHSDSTTNADTVMTDQDVFFDDTQSEFPIEEQK